MHFNVTDCVNWFRIDEDNFEAALTAAVEYARENSRYGHDTNLMFYWSRIADKLQEAKDIGDNGP